MNRPFSTTRFAAGSANPDQVKWIFLVTVAAAFFGALMLFAPPEFVVAGLAGLVVVWIVVERPFVGVVLYMLVQFFRPGEWFPALAPLRPALGVVGLLAMSFLLRLIVKRQFTLVRHRILFVFLLFLMDVGLTAPFAFWKTGAVAGFTDLLRTAVGLFFILHVTTTWKRLRLFLWLWAGIMGILATWNNVLYYSGQKSVPDTGGSGGMFMGFLGDGNDFSLAVNVMIPMMLVFSRVERSAWLRWIMLLAAVMSMVTIIATTSRGGFLGLATGVAMLFLLHRRSGKSIAIIGGAGAMAVLMIFLLLPDMWERDFAKYFDPETNPFLSRVTTITEYDEDESAQGRLDAWQAGLRMVADHPLTGVGIDNYPEAYGRKYKPTDAVTATWRAAHSIYFQVLGELGIPGILLLFAIFYTEAIALWRIRREFADGDEEDRTYVYGLASGLLAGLASFAASGAFLSAFYYPHIWLLGAVIVLLDVQLKSGASAFTTEQEPVAGLGAI